MRLKGLVIMTTELCRTVELTSKKWLTEGQPACYPIIPEKSCLLYKECLYHCPAWSNTDTISDITILFSYMWQFCEDPRWFHHMLQSLLRLKLRVAEFPIRVRFKCTCRCRRYSSMYKDVSFVPRHSPRTMPERWVRNKARSMRVLLLNWRFFFINTTLIKWRCDQNTGWSHLRFLHERCFIWVWVLCNNVILFLWLVLRCCIGYQARPSLFPGGWELHCRISVRLPIHNFWPTHPISL